MPAVRAQLTCQERSGANLEKFLGAWLGAMEGDDGLKLSLKDRLGRFVGQIRAEHEDL